MGTCYFTEPELFCVENDGNIKTRHYGYFPEEMFAGTNGLLEVFYDNTELFLQEMLLNIKHQFAILGNPELFK